MRTAGIAWNENGYRLAVLDADGREVVAGEDFGADEVVELAARLRAVDDVSAVVIESTNGLIDGRLTAAGLPVFRADPAGLPERPSFGSVDARVLADRARTARETLTPLALNAGTLAGRVPELLEGIGASAATEAELTAAGSRLAFGDRGAQQVALTFDDGPNPPFTNRVLDVLARYGVPATFFAVGLHAAVFDEEIARIAEAGHALGNHTWSHPFLPDLTEAELREQIARTDEACQAAGPAVVKNFRPPYGSRTPRVLKTLAAMESHVVTLWDVDSQDWSCPGAEAIVGKTLAEAANGSIVLMHDGGGDRGQTVQALPAVIETLLERGFEFVRVDAMSRAPGRR